MPAMLEEIRKGNRDAKITILIATGCHRGTTKEELIAKFGEEIVNNEKIYIHDCDEKEKLINIGTLPSGGECEINSIAIEADLLVAEGFIEPHFFAGFSGGRKSVLPGIAGRSTVLANHCSEFINHDNVENFDLYQINPVKVSRRDGINYVFNGQHTIEIVATVSGSRETPVWCMIYDELDYVREADIFANQQKYVRPLLPYEIFMANVEAGNDEQLIIKSLVESYGLTISSNKVPGSICAVATLGYIYKKFGFHVLDRTLRLCIGTWEGDVNSLSSNMLKGIAHLVVAFGENLRDDIFKDKVGVFSSREISRTAKERKAGSLGYAEAMLIAYNKRMKAALKWSKLYTNKFGISDENEYSYINEDEVDTIYEDDN